MNNAILENSPRLQRVFKVLLDGQKHTTRDIIRRAAVCAVNSIVAELRENGINVTCERKKAIWYYRLDQE